MKRTLWPWVGWFIFLFVVDFTVPYTFLRDVPKMAGSFLFWSLWSLLAIVSMFAIFLRWRDYE